MLGFIRSLWFTFTFLSAGSLHSGRDGGFPKVLCQGGSRKVTAFTLCYLPGCPGLPPSLRLSSCNTESLSFCLSSTFLSTRLALRRPFSNLESLQDEAIVPGWPKESERARVARARSVWLLRLERPRGRSSLETEVCRHNRVDPRSASFRAMIASDLEELVVKATSIF